MSLTLLLDLDDTLLDNSMSEFLPAYLQAVSAHLTDLVEPSIVVQALLAGTQHMLRHQTPDCTLAENFYSYFYPAIKIAPEVIDPAIESFYAQVFPQLQSLTRPRPEAVRMVEEAFRRGYRVAIATSPLFPLTAIQQRLAWAGFSPDRHPFALVPSIDTFHFAKPNPAYLAEILAQLGWPDEPAIMVGNDPTDDLPAAQGLGLPCFWVRPPASTPPQENEKAIAAGSLDDFFPWLDSIPADMLQPDFNRPSAMMAILQATPAALSSLTRDFAAHHWSKHPKAGQWSLTEIICHLRDVDAEVNLPRLRKIIQEHNPFLPGMDTDPWAEERHYQQQDGRDALRRFTQTRITLLRLLEGLAPEGWARTARHAIFGPTTLRELVSFIVGHDRMHVRQAYETIRTINLSAN